MWARKPLQIILALLSLYSCASIKPLIRTPVTDELTAEKIAPEKNSTPAIPQVKLTKEDVIDNDPVIVVVDEDEPTTPIEEIEASALLETKESLKKEDPVTTVAEKGAEFELNYKKKHYDFWTKYFTTRNKERFKRHVKNGLKYKDVIEEVFEEEGLPKDLFYVGLIESGYNTHIKSRASAVGPWQFIKGTATRYGLYVDRYLDERRNIFKATRAAAAYFKDLYNIFGSWELALCAYNAGEYRIINAIRKGNTRDYKELVAKKLLPKETIFYIPKVAAAKYLVETKHQNLKEPKISELYENAKEVELPKAFSLNKVAKTIGVNVKTLKKLNPDVRRDYVGKRRRYSMYVPQSTDKVALTKIKKLPKARKVARVNRSKKVHRVRRGESLYKIARKYNTTISKLKRVNNLRRNRIFVGQKLVVRAPASKVSSKRPRYYIVRRGDNLYRIAKRFGVSVRRLVKANNLKRKTIFPKQKIILPI